ncbi:MAG: hypothetical protein A3A81_04610 [Omnitrophica bacterium RIFCSPLOWO2_01_FULL_45_10b]|nr:MAG: hypothetical protein A3A81_04610 [Omnitrophica bacterium RIFCSPLOWO2_01_FULL_45_10b]
MHYLDQIGMIASFVLPLFNIPLALRMIQRKSSDDISLIWVIGVWACIILMSPRALTSSDTAFRLFGIMNLIFFTLVMLFTFRYRSFGKQKID